MLYKVSSSKKANFSMLWTLSSIECNWKAHVFDLYILGAHALYFMLLYVLILSCFVNPVSTNSSDSTFQGTCNFVQIVFILRHTQKNQLLKNLILRSHKLPRTTMFRFQIIGRDLSRWLTMQFPENASRSKTAAVKSWESLPFPL